MMATNKIIKCDKCTRITILARIQPLYTYQYNNLFHGKYFDKTFKCLLKEMGRPS